MQSPSPSPLWSPPPPSPSPASLYSPLRTNQLDCSLNLAAWSQSSEPRSFIQSTLIQDASLVIDDVGFSGTEVSFCPPALVEESMAYNGMYPTPDPSMLPGQVCSALMPTQSYKEMIPGYSAMHAGPSMMPTQADVGMIPEGTFELPIAPVMPMMAPVPPQRTPCTWPSCTRTFSRHTDVERHIESVHLGMKHHCYWPGCPNNRGQGYCRQEKLRTHQREKHGMA